MQLYMEGGIYAAAIVAGVFAMLWLLDRLLLRRAVRRSGRQGAGAILRYRWLACLLALSVLFLLLLHPMASLALQWSLKEGRHDIPAHSMILGPCSQLPPTATDVNWSTATTGSLADFAVNEAEFRAWVKKQGLQMHEISGSETIYVGSILARQDITVRNGIMCFSQRSNTGSGTVIVFDRDRGRAYYQWNAG